MEILKFKPLVIAGLLIISSGAFSQDNAKLQQAFSDSYSFEYSKNYTRAIEIIKPFYSEGSYELNMRLGWLSYMAGNFPESVAYYQKAINLIPLSIEARLGMVYPLSYQLNWEGVITQYNEILKTDPQNLNVNYKLGLVYYNREQYTEAKKYFDKYISLYPFEYNAVLMSAWTNLKLSKFSEAKELFNKVLLLSPQDASALEGLGYIK